MDIELAIDALELSPYIDCMVLFSGDGDFRSLVEAMQRRGVSVTVVSTVSTQPAMVADELRRQADEFVDLAHLIPKIGRDPSERAARLASGDFAERGERLERHASPRRARATLRHPPGAGGPAAEDDFAGN